MSKYKQIVGTVIMITKSLKTLEVKPKDFGKVIYLKGSSWGPTGKVRTVDNTSKPKGFGRIIVIE